LALLIPLKINKSLLRGHVEAEETLKEFIFLQGLLKESRVCSPEAAILLENFKQDVEVPLIVVF
jgi:hypothetical protein